MPCWRVIHQARMDRALKNIKGNAPAADRLVEILDSVKNCKDPSDIGERKRGRYRHCYGVHLAKSVSFIYSIDCRSHTAYAVDIGDHKWLYGRDSRP